MTAELQVRAGIEDNSEIVFLLNTKICCDPSLEPSQRDASDKGYNICFNEEVWKIIPKLSLFSLLVHFLSGALPYEPAPSLKSLNCIRCHTSTGLHNHTFAVFTQD